MDTSNGNHDAEPAPLDTKTPPPEPAPVEKIPPPVGPRRAGYTTNKNKPRNKARARMAKVSRVRNRR